jgi:hypothetical protein
VTAFKFNTHPRPKAQVPKRHYISPIAEAYNSNSHPQNTVSIQATIQLKVALEELTLRRDCGVVQVRLAHDGEAAVACKLEVGGGTTRVDLANELARGVPDLDAVAAAGVDVALGVDVDTCCPGQYGVLGGEPSKSLTIGDVNVGKGKGLAVLKGAVLLDVEAVAGWG